MGINSLVTLTEEKEEKSLTDNFNTRLMCSLCNKHPISIRKNEEGKVFFIIEQDLDNSFFVNYDDCFLDINIEGIKYKGLGYIISEINNKNKYSTKYANCTSVIAIGKDRNTGKNISFLTHQHPDSVQGNMFKRDLIKSLDELKEKSLEGSIDIIILGGNNREKFDEYFNTIDELGFLIEEKTGINADVVGGYTNVLKEISSLGFQSFSKSKEIYINTEKRRVYFYKHFLDHESNIDFKATEIDEVINKIENN